MTWLKHEIAPGVTLVRVLNTQFKRFENFWPIPTGTSYNFYVVRGSEGAALIDGTDERVSAIFWEALESVVDPKEIRYVVAQHTEPDHSGTLAEVMARAPNATLLGTKQALQIGEKLAGFPVARSKAVSDGEEVSLGDKTLRFISAPFVHWPDTMMTLLREDGILFTCDMFGSHGVSRAVYYDESLGDFELRDYYASILMAYSNMVARALEKVKEVKPRVIAPGHGALHRDVSTPIEMYERWASWRPLRRALVVVGSQYERTAKLAEAAAEGLSQAGLEPVLVDAAEAEPDDLLAETLEAAALLIATSTHNGRPFIGITFYLDLLEEYKPRNKVAAVLGSHGWAGGALRVVRQRLEGIDIPVVGELAVKESPTPEEVERAEELGKRLGEEALKLVG